LKLIQYLLDLIFPHKCPFCGRVLERYEQGMCERCQPVLPWTDGENDPVEFCDVSLSPLRYRDGVREAMHRFKFLRGQEHGDLFGVLMAQCLRDRLDETADAVVWVPLSRRGLRRRGYDQAELLARRVAEEMGLPLLPVLEKVRDTSVQSSIKGDSARRANVVGAYRVRAGVDLTGKHVVLVDDVVTSGATLSECALCLRLAGAANVYALTFARAK